jgi:AraC-like DNA-binding protein
MARVQNLLLNRRKLREHYQPNLVLQPQKLTLLSTEEKFLQKILQVIESNLAREDFDVEQLSREVGMSRVQLYRKLYALTGQSPSDFIRNIRLQRAAQLLKARAGGVAEIAYQVGFKDAAHFTKSFTKQFGKTPTAYSHAQENVS